MEKGQLKEEKILKICKKIRFYPQKELEYQAMLILYRRAYNLAIEKYKNNEYKDKNGLWRDLRKEIRFQCEEEQKNKNSVYNSNIVNEAVLSAKKSFKAVINKNKKSKNRATLRFKSRKKLIQSFILIECLKA